MAAKLTRLISGFAVAAASASTGKSDEVAAVQVGLNLHGLDAHENQPYREKLNNFEDLEYEGILNIGGQQIKTIYDTGSFELLVISKRCKSSVCHNNHGYYDPYLSNTRHQGTREKSHHFGNGACDSTISDELIKVANSNITATGQYFWEVTQSTMGILRDGSFGAILGMGDPRTVMGELQKSGDQEFYNFMQTRPTMIKKLGITKFSVCFLRPPLSPGFFTWNDFDPAGNDMKSLFQKVPIAGVKEWTGTLSDVSFQDHNIDCSRNKCMALLDTGTSLISAPQSAITKLTSLLRSVGGNTCSNLHRMPNLKIKFGGTTLNLPPATYIGKTRGYAEMLRSENQKFFDHIEGHGGCEITMLSLDITAEDEVTPLWILGMPFFREFYTTFDLGHDHEYSTNEFARSVHVARADKECNHPRDQLREMEGDRTEVLPRTFDLSKVRVPEWAKQAHKGGQPRSLRSVPQ